MKNEKFLQSLLNLNSEKIKREKENKKQILKDQKEKIKKEKQEKKTQEKIKKEKYQKIIDLKCNINDLKENNAKWFWITLFWKRETQDKNILISYVQNLEKVSRSIKSDIIKEIQKGIIYDQKTIDQIVSILSIENLIKKENDQIKSIELENELNNYINGINWNQTWNILEKQVEIKTSFLENDQRIETIKKVNIFFLVSNAYKKMKYQETRSNEKYDEYNNNFFGIDETKNKEIISDQINYKYIIEKLKEEKNRSEFETIFKDQEKKKDQFRKEIQSLKEDLKNKVKEIEKELKNGEDQKDISQEKIKEIQEIKIKIEEIQKARNIEKTSENRKIRNIVEKWHIEKYL